MKSDNPQSLKSKTREDGGDLEQDLGTLSKTRNQKVKISWPVKIVSLLAVFLTLWHVFASFLWIFPPSPLRQLVPAKALTAYMIPFFGQSWSVFAPEPINGDYHFNVRAVIDVDGEEKETGWVSANTAEMSIVQNHLFPPRAGVQAEELASMQRQAFLKLEEPQRTILAGDFDKKNWETGMREALLADQKNTTLVDGYLDREHMATAYATQVAKAMWADEGEIVKVQYRVSRQNVVPFADRNNPNVERPEPFIVSTGWRGLIVNPDQDEEVFADVFRPLFERSVGLR